MSGNLLIDKYPNISKEWCYEKNSDYDINKITCGSHKKVWWKCDYGHQYEQVVNKRIYRNQGCKSCGIINNLNENSLAVKCPELIKEWNFTKNKDSPQEVLFGSNKKVWWICEKKHEWETYIIQRSYGSKCPYCVGKYATDENNFAVNFPHLIFNWDYIKNDKTPFEYTPQSHELVWWKCFNGHSFKKMIFEFSKNNNCSECHLEDNNLEILFPELIKEWNYDKNIYVKPSDFSYGSIKKVWWICEKNHEWEMIICHRTVNKHDCPYCAGKKISEDNCLETKFPLIAKQWHPNKNNGLTPKDVTCGSNIKIWWICEKGHEWKTTIVKRSSGSECPNCLSVAFSRSAIKWLSTISKNEKIFIQHAGNGGEYVIILNNNKKFKVDGYCKDTNTIFEYFGCIYHSHLPELCKFKKKYYPSEINPIVKKLNKEIYDKTLERIKIIKELGYNLIYIWECEDKLLNKIK